LKPLFTDKKTKRQVYLYRLKEKAVIQIGQLRLTKWKKYKKISKLIKYLEKHMSQLRECAFQLKKSKEINI